MSVSVEFPTGQKRISPDGHRTVEVLEVLKGDSKEMVKTRNKEAGVTTWINVEKFRTWAVVTP